MKNVKNLSKRALLLLAGLCLVAIGGTGAVVNAAIPDADGIVHGCVVTLTGAARIIDTGASGACTGLETGVNWSASGIPQMAYAALNSGGTLDSSYSSGITSISVGQADSEDPNSYFVCFNVSFTPKAAMVSPVSTDMIVKVRDPNGMVNNYCGTGYNAIAMGGISTSTYAQNSYTFYK